ncbi:hypothetical protein TRFO_39391 [Tritrichomonas foetus]|uniref:Right handed beta helix domain-containing protein n=1 Tax=Tritrichomonas foetus TaxID=1144522 RepID=A0A1J4J553_9EUKA|nr:hypothetical protein TRFO_39391 [Tritrichomonas foetus]|eukprot:OHS94422.1 hypothetical protein TRFO_39391 [Tritrichomonas foetus]
MFLLFSLFAISIPAGKHRNNQNVIQRPISTKEDSHSHESNVPHAKKFNQDMKFAIQANLLEGQSYSESTEIENSETEADISSETLEIFESTETSELDDSATSNIEGAEVETTTEEEPPEMVSQTEMPLPTDVTEHQCTETTKYEGQTFQTPVKLLCSSQSHTLTIIKCNFIKIASIESLIYIKLSNLVLNETKFTECNVVNEEKGFLIDVETAQTVQTKFFKCEFTFNGKRKNQDHDKNGIIFFQGGSLDILENRFENNSINLITTEKSMNVNVKQTTFSNSSITTGKDLYIQCLKINISYCKFKNVELTLGPNNDKNPRKDDCKISVRNTNFGPFSQNASQNIITILDGTTEVDFSECSFTDCKTNNSIILCPAKRFLFELSNFSFSTLTPCISLSLTSSNFVTINDCNFTNCDGKGNCIYCPTKGSTLEIDNCIFQDCGQNDSCSIYTNMENNNIISSVFNFTSNNKACSSIAIYKCTKLTIDFCSFYRCHNKNNTMYGGGAGFHYVPDDNFPDKESFTLTNLLFYECSGNSAAFSIFAKKAMPYFNNITFEKLNCNYSFSLFYMVNTIDIQLDLNEIHVKNCTNTAADGGGLGFMLNTIQTTTKPIEVVFTRCTFNGNSSPIGGGLSFGNGTTTNHAAVSFFDCNFTKNKATSYQGGAISIISDRSLIVENCTFIQNQCHSKGGAIYIYHTSNLKVNSLIKNCYFTGNTDTNNQYHAIYHTGDGAGDFTNISFYNNGNNGDALYTEMKNIRFYNLSFTFTQLSQATRGIEIYSNSKFEIDECNFSRCCTTNGRPHSDGGAILYRNSGNRIESMSISNCNFECCSSPNSAVMRIEPYSMVPKIENLTIKNMSNNYLISFIYNYNIFFSTVYFKNVVFENCINSASDGGGSGIWISNHRLEGNPFQSNIEFINCTFKNNTGVYGGAFGVGDSDNVAPTSLVFNNCKIFNNKGTKQGGAIFLKTSESCTLTSCVLENNTCNEEGGAIFCKFRTKSLLTLNYTNITNCVSLEDGAPNVTSGNAVYCSVMLSEVYINNSHILNCGTKHAAISLMSDCTMINSTIIFDSKENSTYGIVFDFVPEILINGCLFRHCCADVVKNTTDKSLNQGGAIDYRTYGKEFTTVEIINNIFDDNFATDKGASVYLGIITPPVFEGNTFINHDCHANLMHVNFFDSKALNITFELYNNSFNGNNFNEHAIFHLEIADTIISNGIYYFQDCYLLNNKNFVLTGFDHPTVSFENCSFYNNSNSNHSLLKFDTNHDVTFIRCNFDYDDSKNGTLDIQTTSKILIINCTFSNENCISFGGLFRVNFSEIEFDTVSILNCCPRNISTILGGGQVIMRNVNYTLCEGILIPVMCNITMQNVTFYQCISGLFYQPEKYSTETEDHLQDVLVLEDITIDTIYGNAGIIYIFNNLDVKNLTLKNCISNSSESVDSRINSKGTHKLENGENQSAKPILELKVMNESLDHVILDGFNFVNNKYYNCENDVTGGGSGLIITFPDERDPENSIIPEIPLKQKNENILEQETTEISTPPEVIPEYHYKKFDFINCRFEGNQAKVSGGAYAIERNDTMVSFSNCEFIGNSCLEGNGGALYFRTKYEVVINDCVFIKNQAFGIGGAVFLEQKHPYSMSSCSFIDNIGDFTFYMQTLALQENDYIGTHDYLNCSLYSCQFTANVGIPLLIKTEFEVYIEDTTFEKNVFNENIPRNNELLDTRITTINIVSPNKDLTKQKTIALKRCKILLNDASHFNNIVYINSSNHHTICEEVDCINNHVQSDHYHIYSKNSYQIDIISCNFRNIEDETDVRVIHSDQNLTLINTTIIGYQSSNYSILCYREKIDFDDKTPNKLSVIIQNVKIENSAGIYIDECSNFVFQNVSMNDCLHGLVFLINGTQNNKIKYNSNNYPEVVLIENCIFDHITYYAMRININKNIHFQNVTLQNCDQNSTISSPVIPPPTSAFDDEISFSEESGISESQLLEKHDDHYDHPDKVFVPIIELTFYDTKSNSFMFENCVFYDNHFHTITNRSSLKCGGIGLSILYYQNGQIFNRFSDLTNKNPTKSSLIIRTCEFEGNTADNSGGGFYLDNYEGEITIDDCQFNNNNIFEGDGGGLYLVSYSTLTIQSCAFVNNTSPNSCSMFLNMFDDSSILDSNFTAFHSSNYQILLISNNQQTTTIERNMFAYIQPVSTQIRLQKGAAQSKILRPPNKNIGGDETRSNVANSIGSFNFKGNSFMYFLDENLIRSHIETDNDPSEIKINFYDVNCFDTNEKIVLNKNYGYVSNSTTTSSECPYPKIVDEIIKNLENNGSTSAFDPSDGEINITNGGSTDSNSENGEGSKNNTALIIGATIGAVVFVIIIADIIWLFLWMRKKKQSNLEKTSSSSLDAFEISQEFEQETNESMTNKYSPSSITVGSTTVNSVAATQENPLFSTAFMDDHSSENDCFEECDWSSRLI